tara:strand:- start:390 stop:560 length:171 start_codon:yes stop_codon:yes gene_type:complete
MRIGDLVKDKNGFVGLVMETYRSGLWDLHAVKVYWPMFDISGTHQEDVLEVISENR